MTRKTNTLKAIFAGFRAARLFFLLSFLLLLSTQSLLAQFCTGCPTCPRNGARDTTKPIARCKPTLTVSLDSTGFRAISPLEIDNFSIDNCPIIWIWADHTCFICRDAGQIVPVTLFVEDTAGNRSTCRTMVTIRDVAKPMVRNCPSNMSFVVNNGACEKEKLTFTTPTFLDNCTASRNMTVTQTSGLPSGSNFPIGVTTNTFVGRDSIGNSSQCTFNVTVSEQVSQVAPNGLACLAQFKVSLVSTCETAITPKMLLASTENLHCLSDFRVTLKYGATTLPNNIVNGSHLNKTLIGTVTSTRNGVSCSANVEVIDGVAPVLQAPQSVLLTCAQLNGEAVPPVSISGEPIIVSECSPSVTKYFVDTLFDANCLGTFSSRPANFPTTATFNATWGALSSRIIARTHTVTDAFNNRSQVNQIIYLQKPNLNLVGINPTVNLACNGGNVNLNPDAVTLNGVLVAGTGRPTYNSGSNVSIQGCQIASSYTDSRETLSNGYRIVRTWNLGLPCTGETRILEQTINVIDEKPSISCRTNYKVNIQSASQPTEIFASFVVGAFSDDCTPLSNLTLAMRPIGSGSGFPISDRLAFTCNDTGNVTVEVWVKDETGQTNYCTATIRIANENNVCPVPTRPSLTGTIQTEAGLPILARVNLGGSSTEMRYSESGQFKFTEILRGGNFSITPQRDTDWVNGVTTADINVMSKLILGSVSFPTAYRYIAADMNRDSFVDALDMLLMRRLILLVMPSINGNTSWRFMPKDFEFPAAREPLTVHFPSQMLALGVVDSVSKLDFIGVKTGDLNGSARTNVVGGGTVEPRGANPLIINANDEILEIGKPYEITLAMPKTDVKGFQFTLNYDKSKIHISKIRPLDLYNFDETNYAIFPEHGKVTVSWNHLSSGNIAEPMNMMSLHLTVRQPTRLSEVLRLTSDLTPVEAFDAAGVVRTVQLKFTGKNTEGGTFALFNAEPNPVAALSTTSIPFRLPEATDVKLTLLDETGRILSTQTRFFEKGEQTWRIETPSVSGVVMYRVDTPTHSATRRLVIVR